MFCRNLAQSLSTPFLNIESSSQKPSVATGTEGTGRPPPLNNSSCAQSTIDRYGICSRPIRGLLPFVREAVAVPISADGRARRAASPPPPSLPPSRLLLKPRSACLEAGRGASSGDCSGISSDAKANGAVGEREEGGQQTRTLLESMVEALGPGFDCQEQVR